MTKYIDRYYLNWELYGIKFAGWGGWWQPWANTIAYYPLNSTNTVNDLSWNNYNLTNTNTTFGTNAWVSCASFNGSNSKLTATIWTLPQWANARTTSLWVYSQADTRSIMWYWANRTRYWCREMMHGNSSEWFGIVCYYIDEYSWENILDAWTLVTTTYDGDYIKIYINWELQYTSTAYTLETSWGNFEIGNPYSTNYFYWYASNAIIEDKARTAQEIQDYFDQTKSLYGIS